MMAEEARSRLGRGLAALIGDVGDEPAAIERVRSQRRIPIEFLRPNPRNPRKNFDEAELEGLTESIRERGVAPSFNCLEVEAECVTITAMTWQGTRYEPYRTWRVDRRLESARTEEAWVRAPVEVPV